jgi:hypothetical protein
VTKSVLWKLCSLKSTYVSVQSAFYILINMGVSEIKITGDIADIHDIDAAGGCREG